MHKRTSPEAAAVRLALGAWESTVALASQPLSRHKAVEAHRQARGYSDSPAGRGLALREALDEALASLRPDGGDPDPLEKRWRPYLAISEQFVRGRSATAIADELAIARRTYYVEQATALESMADWFRSRSEQLGTTGRSEAAIERRESGGDTVSFRAPFLAPPLAQGALVGRERLVAQLRSMLREPPREPIALCGLPGVGKTSVALALAHEPFVATTFPGGVLWAGLGKGPDLAAILGYWARAVGAASVELRGATTARDRARLVQALMGGRPALTVIDDAWSQDAVAALLTGGPGSATIVTTRSTALAAEVTKHVVTVQELDVPDSVSLLRDVVGPAGSAIDDGALREVAGQIGGLPLGLTLVAHHLRRASNQPRRLEAAMVDVTGADTRLRLAMHPGILQQSADLPSSEPASLLAAIELSAAALTDSARKALRDVALFPPKPDAFSEEIALAAMAGGGTGPLDELVDNGLLETSDQGRYTMHQTIADYARTSEPRSDSVRNVLGYLATHANGESLLADLACALAATDAGAQMGLAQETIACVNALRPAVASDGLFEAEAHLIGAAVHAAESLGDRGAYAEAVMRRGFNELNRGELGTALESFTVASVASLESDPPSAATSELRRGLAIALIRAGRGDEAEEILDTALQLAESAEDRLGVCRTLLVQGVLHTDRGDYRRAAECIGRAMPLARDLGLNYELGIALHNTGRLHLRLGDLDVAADYYGLAAELCAAIGDRLGAALALHDLAVVALRMGDFARAKAKLVEAQTVASSIGDELTEALIQRSTGELHLATGDASGAIGSLVGSLETCRRLGYRRGEADALRWLGVATLRSGDPAAAEIHARESIAVAESTGFRDVAASGQQLLGEVLYTLGKFDDAEIASAKAVHEFQALGDETQVAATKAQMASARRRRKQGV